MNAKFILPDFVTGEAFYDYLVTLKDECPDVFYDFTELKTIYGVFGSCVWNGGTLTIAPQWTRQSMEELIYHFNYDLGLTLRFTFTNPFIDQSLLNDTYCNMICELGHNGQNEISVVSPILERYLRDKYPRYKFVRSIVAAEHDQPYCLNSGNGDYSTLVLKRINNNNWDLLDHIDDKDRAHIELLCNDPCPDNCPRLYTHYRDFARYQLEYKAPDEGTNCSMWEVKGRFPVLFAKTQLKTYIGREAIDNEYLPKGYQYFKLSGRNDIRSLISNALEYLIVPEYKTDVIVEMLGTLELTP